LLHKEFDSYLTAEGIFTEKELIEDIHLRARSTKGGFDIDLSSTNANTFWQIEVEGEVMKGSPVAWDTNVRLKHMITRRYLQVKGGDLSLTEPKSTPTKHSVFRFSPLVKTGLFIENENYAKIHNPFSDQYLQGGKWTTFFLVLALFFSFFLLHYLFDPLYW